MSQHRWCDSLCSLRTEIFFNLVLWASLAKWLPGGRAVSVCMDLSLINVTAKYEIKQKGNATYLLTLGRVHADGARAHLFCERRRLKMIFLVG